MAQKDEKIK